MRLFGKNPVIERIKANPGSIKIVYLQKTAELSEVVRYLRQENINFVSVEKRDFYKLTGDVHSQGVLAEVEGFKYADFDDFLQGEKSDLPCILFLDGITDPQNLGSILRSAACMGGFAIVIPKHDSVDINETVLRVASGAENHIPIAVVTNMSHAVQKAKEYHFWVAGAVVEGGQDLTQTDLPFPLALVIGSEGKGIRKGLLEHLDLKLTLPMRGAQLSFNVASATALFCYEITRQRN